MKVVTDDVVSKLAPPHTQPRTHDPLTAHLPERAGPPWARRASAMGVKRRSPPGHPAAAREREAVQREAVRERVALGEQLPAAVAAADAHTLRWLNHRAALLEASTRAANSPVSGGWPNCAMSVATERSRLSPAAASAANAASTG